ncbi:MAG: hypothetical protein IJQ39_13930 [Thermoguttaceae bacterium]|nr:hypothetical protein [Thermoguttaceae bacterium]
MNNNLKTDEILPDAELKALEARLSVITDVSRSDSDLAQLSESERSQAQTFDKLVNLANRGIALKPVSFTIPSVSPPTSARKTSYKKGIIAALAAAVCVIISVVAVHQTLTTTPSNPGSKIESNVSESTDNTNNSSLNYWNDSFDNQISEFEGEMICLCANYNNSDFVVGNMNYIEDFSEEGDF